MSNETASVLHESWSTLLGKNLQCRRSAAARLSSVSSDLYYRRSDPAAAQWRRLSFLCGRRPALPAVGSSSGAEEAKLHKDLFFAW
jgi:hypothetical protein